MPELPEVETIRRGLAPHIENRMLTAATVRCPRLRYPVDRQLKKHVEGKKIIQVSRRSKYLQFHFDQGGLLCHLGMSGSLHVVTAKTPVKKHDHIDLHFRHCILRYNDPRRFGLLLVVDDFDDHPLLNHLGPEPLQREFSTKYFYNRLQNQKRPIKIAIMAAENVVGVGNIYANEVLFQTGIHPLTKTNQLNQQQVAQLLQAIKKTLRRAIKAGGSSLKDFVNTAGKPGYFQQQLAVYGRDGQPCVRCQTAIELIRLGQRSTFFCPTCQH